MDRRRESTRGRRGGEGTCGASEVVERGDCYSRWWCTAWSGEGGTRRFLAGNGNGVYSGGKMHMRLRCADGGEARVEQL
jgi:hypothetical protein